MIRQLKKKKQELYFIEIWDRRVTFKKNIPKEELMRGIRKDILQTIGENISDEDLALELKVLSRKGIIKTNLFTEKTIKGISQTAALEEQDIELLPP